MAGIQNEIYRRMPVPLQHALISMYGVYWYRARFGGEFENDVAKFRERELYDSHQWEKYGEQQLRRLVLNAYDEVPYYRDKLRDIHRRDLEQITLSQLGNLPLLEKQTVRDNPEALLVGGSPDKKHMVQHTSGSTGTPINIYYLPRELQFSMAIREARSCKFAGVSFKMPRATFSGRVVEPDPNSKGPFYRFNVVERQVYFSAFHLSPPNVPQYLRALKRHNVQWITGYSSSIYQLAHLTEDQGLVAPTLKAVITTSEKITSEMREVIERVFRTRVYEEYGTVENLFYVCECSYGRKHINPDAGVIEILDERFEPVPPGQMGEVVATGFMRPSQPMIRFRIGDLAVMDDQPCPCGRHMPVLSEVVGRLEDTIYGLDGRRLMRFGGVFFGQPHVYEGQIIQEKLDLIRVRIVPKAGFGDDDRADITHRIHQRLTDQMRVEIELVDAIERTTAGKFRMVVCRLSEEDLRQISHLKV